MNTIFETVKQQASLTEYARAHLQKAAAGGEFVCPNCGSGGSGRSGSDSAFHIDENKGFFCHSCNFCGDIFNLCAYVEHLEPQSREVLEHVANFAGVVLDEGTQPVHSKAKPAKKAAQTVTAEMLRDREKSRAYIEQTKQHLTDAAAVAYIEARGYTMEQLQAIGAGYDASESRLVLPYEGADYYCVCRDITGNSPNKYEKNPRFSKRGGFNLGAEPLYNSDIVQKETCVFIVEGVFDMLALNTLGFKNVIPLVGNGRNCKPLLDAIDKAKPAPCICLALDKDEVGAKTQVELREKLEHRGVAVHEVNKASLKGKDADEMRLNDPQALKAAFEQAGAYVVEHKEELIRAARTKLQQEFLKEHGEVDKSEPLHALVTGKGIPPAISTGIKSLDARLNGGLHEGLYVLCAGSSMGKTTLMLQIADNIASSGRAVLFVSMEQSARELIAKSISRISHIENKKNAVTVNALLFNEAKPVKQITGELKKLEQRYLEKISPNLTICEPQKQLNALEIRALAQAVKDIHGASPVVFIDYLQLLAAQNEHDTDKRAVDNNIGALRRLARDFKTPVFLISSLNRESYWAGVRLDSAKESGGIEYSADVFLGFQPFNLMGKIQSVKEQRKCSRETAARIVFDEYKESEVCFATLTIAKNRNGKTLKADKIKLKNYAEFARFESVKLVEDETPPIQEIEE